MGYACGDERDAIHVVFGTNRHVNVAHGVRGRAFYGSARSRIDWCQVDPLATTSRGRPYLPSRCDERQMFNRRGTNGAAVERLRQRFSKLNEPIHLRSARRRNTCLATDLFALADLMNQKYDREDGERGDELKAAAVVDLARTIEQHPQLTGRDNPNSDREAAQQEGVVPSKNAHVMSSAGGSLLVIGS
jgi:hypothetical protein